MRKLLLEIGMEESSFDDVGLSIQQRETLWSILSQAIFSLFWFQFWLAGCFRGMCAAADCAASVKNRLVFTNSRQNLSVTPWFYAIMEAYSARGGDDDETVPNRRICKADGRIH